VVANVGTLRTRIGSRTLGQMAMWVGTIEFDLRLGDVHSLKDKRSVVRPLIADVRRKFSISVAEVDHLDLHRRAGLGVALVSSERSRVVEVLDAVERLVAYRPEVELLSTRRTLAHPAVD
jgi:uncharacterized protein YlxP (DUF503 family)